MLTVCLLVIWKKPKETRWFFYLIESPVYDQQAQRFRNPRNPEKAGNFPYSLKKMVLQQDKLVIPETPTAAGLTIEQIQQAWGRAGLPKFNLPEDELVVSLNAEIRSM